MVRILGAATVLGMRPRTSCEDEQVGRSEGRSEIRLSWELGLVRFCSSLEVPCVAVAAEHHSCRCVAMDSPASQRKYHSVFDVEVLKRELDLIGVKQLHVFTIWTYVSCLILLPCWTVANVICAGSHALAGLVFAQFLYPPRIVDTTIPTEFGWSSLNCNGLTCIVGHSCSA